MRWEELTAWEFDAKREEAGGLCMIPFGILESHGPHMPLGTDTMWAEHVAVHAAELEPAIVFPANSMGYLTAKQHAGNLCLPYALVSQVLDALCVEIGRNGFGKIVIVNGHGGNVNGVNHFVETTLEEKKNYVVYHFFAARLILPAIQRVHEHGSTVLLTEADREVIADLATGRRPRAHAGVDEAALVAGVGAHLLKLDRAYDADFSKRDRLTEITEAGVMTWNRWYATYPNNYAGDPAGANERIGEAILAEMATALAGVLALIKDDETLDVQNEYFSRWVGGDID